MGFSWIVYHFVYHWNVAWRCYYSLLYFLWLLWWFVTTSGTAAHSERICRGGGHVLLQQAGEWGAHKLALVPTGTPWYIRPRGVCPKPNLSVLFCLLWPPGRGRRWPHVQDGICGEHGPCHGCRKGKSQCAKGAVSTNWCTINPNYFISVKVFKFAISNL